MSSIAAMYLARRERLDLGLGNIRKAIRKVRNGTRELWKGRHFITPGHWPGIVLYFGASPGDDLLCTTAARELAKRGEGKIWTISNYPEIFSVTGDVARVLPTTYFQEIFARVRRWDYRPLEYNTFDGIDRSEPAARHIIAEVCARAGVRGSVELRPHLKLREQEIAAGAFAANYIAIQSSGMAGRLPMLNKQWYPERFQAVVDCLRGDIEFIQLGSSVDPALQRVTDLRGRTSIRESAAVLYSARAYIGSVGFLMHLARAAECPSVIIYGGREAPWQSGYVCNFNLFNSVSCAPCWRWNSCDFDRRCMQEISIDQVVNAIRQMLQRPRGPLAIETAEI